MPSTNRRRKSSLRSGLTTAGLLVAIGAGVMFGLGVFTFQYAEGFSYLSTDPAACANCHIMQSQYASWQRASHHTVAGCVDCHLPRHGIGKWISKADNGYRHSKAFTLQDFHEPIVMIDRSRRILQQNCLDCHDALTHQMAAGEAAAVSCIHCHRDVGHGERAGLGGPLRAAETDLAQPAPEDPLHE